MIGLPYRKTVIISPKIHFLSDRHQVSFCRFPNDFSVTYALNLSYQASLKFIILRALNYLKEFHKRFGYKCLIFALACFQLCLTGITLAVALYSA